MSRGCLVPGAWFPASGFTLLEVMVVLLILGLIIGMSGLAFTALRAPPGSEATRELRRARSEAILTGQPVVTVGNHAPHTTQVLFLPDGRGIGSGADPLTGAPRDSAP
jgi:prepilin-type N-terminal cleavage/methylation domain-containing protein